MGITYLVVFFISLFCIALELFFTRILNLNAWNNLYDTACRILIRIQLTALPKTIVRSKITSDSPFASEAASSMPSDFSPRMVSSSRLL